MDVPGSPGRPRRWEELSSPGLAELSRLRPPAVGLIPVGATEQHGPHLPTGTDTLVARALCEALSERTEAVVLPALPVGVSRWHGLGRGTLALDGEDLARLAVATAGWAGASGLCRLLFVNGHVGNAPALRLATDRLRFERPDLHVGILEWWTLSEAIADEVERDAADWHANRAETSLVLAIRPDLVDLAAARVADDEDRATGQVFSYAAEQCSTNGVTGRPSEASVELGRRLWDEVVAAAVTVVARARIERPPLG